MTSVYKKKWSYIFISLCLIFCFVYIRIQIKNFIVDNPILNIYKNKMVDAHNEFMNEYQSMVCSNTTWKEKTKSFNHIICKDDNFITPIKKMFFL